MSASRRLTSLFVSYPSLRRILMTLAAFTGTLAQATLPAAPGAPAAPAATEGGGMTWLWIVIGLAIIAGLVWYFMRGRSRATTSSTSATSSGAPSGRPSVYDNEKR